MAGSALIWTLVLAGVLGSAHCIQLCASVGYTTEVIFYVQCYGITNETLWEVTAVLTRIKIKFPTYVISVDCSNSVGADIPDTIFEGYKIVRLKMSNVGFSTLPYGLLSTLGEHIIGLDFSGNRIDSVDFEQLNRLPFTANLRDLQLHDNQIQELPADAFAQLAKLQILHLQNNRIEELVDNVFRGLTNLTDLYLFENHIGAVGAEAFAVMPKLKLLTIDLNRIQFLEEGTLSVENHASLKEIALEGNPFHCNCSLQWFKDYLQSINYLVSSGATCVYPRIEPFAAIDFCEPDQE